MITLKSIKDYIREYVASPSWAISKRNSKAEESITIYDAQGPTPIISVGGLKNTRTDVKAVSILVHWGHDPDKAELKAIEVFDFFFGMNHETTINNHQIITTELRKGKPIFVGTDDDGIYEYVIEVLIKYMK
ncbi:MAG: minor capsid protein [Coprobacillaceae bacterium]